MISNSDMNTSTQRPKMIFGAMNSVWLHSRGVEHNIQARSTNMATRGPSVRAGTNPSNLSSNPN